MTLIGTSATVAAGDLAPESVHIPNPKLRVLVNDFDPAGDRGSVVQQHDADAP